MRNREREPLPDWPRSKPTPAVVATITATLQARGLRVADPHIEHRFRDRLCFGVSCVCGMTVDAEVDLYDDQDELRARVDWMVGVVGKRPCLAGECARRIAAEKAEREQRQREERERKSPTREQLRELMRDPFIRAALAAFGPETNVIGAAWPDGATWRNWEESPPPSAEDAALAERWRNSNYVGGPLPPAPRANWGEKKKR